MLRLMGDRCTVRSWRKTDADALVRHADNINVAKHLRDRFPHPYTEGHAKFFLKHAAAGEDPTNLASTSMAVPSAPSATFPGATSSASPPRSATGWAKTSGAAAS